MRKKVWEIPLSIMIVICLGAGSWFFYHQASTQKITTVRDLAAIETAYDASAAVAAAQEKLQQPIAPAAILHNDTRKQQQIALTLDGLPDRTTMVRILELLKKYHIQATFFVEGMNAAADPESIAEIVAAGYDIGNYTWIGLNKIEQLPKEKRLADFCKTQQALQTLTNAAPTLLKCTQTVYTLEVLQDAKACGLENIIKNDRWFPRNQLRDEQAAQSFVKKLKAGSILSIPLGTPVDMLIYQPGKTDDRPAVDKQPGIREFVVEGQLTEPLVDELERFFLALQQANWQTVRLQDFPSTKYIPSAAVAKAPQAS